MKRKRTIRMRESRNFWKTMEGFVEFDTHRTSKTKKKVKAADHLPDTIL